MLFNLFPEQKEKPDINNLICNYSKMLMRICYLYLKDYQLAEEAVQDTLLKVYSKYSVFENKSSEKTWVTKIAINVCKDYMRKPSYKLITQNDIISLSYATEDDDLAEYTDEQSVRLLNTVMNLPIQFKQVILLHYYQDLSISEIAKILQQKPNTISVRLKRSKEMLKEFLEEE